MGDTMVAVEWIENQDSFKSAVSDKSGVVWLGLPKGTDLWQPVDAGYAQLLKVLMHHDFENWLDDDEHADWWYANENPFTALERRVLITYCGGNAYHKLCSPVYDELCMKRFCQNGSDDNLDKPEGLNDYVIPPPSFIQPYYASLEPIDVEAEEMQISKKMISRWNPKRQTINLTMTRRTEY